jgi:hypothetical protein
MRLRLWLVAMAITLLPASLAHAADANGASRIRGSGADSCAKFLDDRRSSLLVEPYRDWLDGFLTALNTQIPNTYDIAGGTDMDGILEWISKWCEVNPGSTFLTGVQAYVTFAYRSRTRSE